MSKVTYDQKGYCGSSMSRRAASAYAGGEKPTSKWSKSEMLGAIVNFCDECGLYCDGEELQKMTKAEIFDRFFFASSWHHTGKFAQVTDFYGLDEEAVRESFRELTEDEKIAKKEAKAAEREALRLAEAARAAEEDSYRQSHRGLSKSELKKAEKVFYAYPELFWFDRKSKSGKAEIWKTTIDEDLEVVVDEHGPRFSHWLCLRSEEVEMAIERMEGGE